MIWLLLIAAWGAAGWRLRGGAFDRLTGLRLGTQAARLLFGGLWIVAPAAVMDWRALLLVPCLWLGLVAAPWGGFMDLSRDGGPPRESPRAFYTWALGLIWKRETWLRDAAGLLLCGLALMLPSAIATGFLHGIGAAFVVEAAGLSLLPAYALAYAVRWPLDPKLADTDTVWGEFGVGAAVASAIFLAWGFL